MRAWRHLSSEGKVVLSSTALATAASTLTMAALLHATDASWRGAPLIPAASFPAPAVAPAEQPLRTLLQHAQWGWSSVEKPPHWQPSPISTAAAPAKDMRPLAPPPMSRLTSTRCPRMI